VGGVTGFLKGTFFYRRPVGPGFALIGDAGHFKDFVTGHGMTDAFLDAERMAAAVLDGRDEAYRLYWHLRDVETMPLHFDAIRQGRTDYNAPLMRRAIGHLGKTPVLIERAIRSFHRELPPAEIIPTATMARIVGAALLRGQFDVLPGFLRMGKALGAEARELAQHERLLEAARVELAHAAPRTSLRTEPRAA
jgi:flavin-dependent dehydrogenase